MAYRSGKMWPGLTKSLATAAESASFLIVVARSAAEMPVLTPSLASTVTVNAVRMLSVFCVVISGSWSRSRSSPRIEAQMTPLV